jgi:hypothetical protein
VDPTGGVGFHSVYKISNADDGRQRSVEMNVVKHGPSREKLRFLIPHYSTDERIHVISHHRFDPRFAVLSAPREVYK